MILEFNKDKNKRFIVLFEDAIRTIEELTVYPPPANGWDIKRMGAWIYSWEQDGINLFEGKPVPVKNLEALASEMNKKDKLGNWKVEGPKIVGGDNRKLYGRLKLKRKSSAPLKMKRSKGFYRLISPHNQFLSERIDYETAFNLYAYLVTTALETRREDTTYLSNWYSQNKASFELIVQKEKRAYTKNPGQELLDSQHLERTVQSNHPELKPSLKIPDGKEILEHLGLVKRAGETFVSWSMKEQDAFFIELINDKGADSPLLPGVEYEYPNEGQLEFRLVRIKDGNSAIFRPAPNDFTGSSIFATIKKEVYRSDTNYIYHKLTNKTIPKRNWIRREWTHYSGGVLKKQGFGDRFVSASLKSLGAEAATTAKFRQEYKFELETSNGLKACWQWLFVLAGNMKDFPDGINLGFADSGANFPEDSSNIRMIALFSPSQKQAYIACQYYIQGERTDIQTSVYIDHAQEAVYEKSGIDNFNAILLDNVIRGNLLRVRTCIKTTNSPQGFILDHTFNIPDEPAIT